MQHESVVVLKLKDTRMSAGQMVSASYNIEHNRFEIRQTIVV